MEYDFFLSYASEDIAYVEKLLGSCAPRLLVVDGGCFFFGNHHFAL